LIGVDWLQRPFGENQTEVLARHGVVATEEPLAAQAGLRILQRGGNAVDAAVATAIALTVTSPVANGIGSDAFVLVWDGSKLHGLNASGRAGSAHSPDLFSALGLAAVPMFGWLSRLALGSGTCGPRRGRKGPRGARASAELERGVGRGDDRHSLDARRKARHVRGLWQGADDLPAA
jgi:hypothetical protein